MEHPEDIMEELDECNVCEICGQEDCALDEDEHQLDED